MSDCRIHFTHDDMHTADSLTAVEELGERVALEQLAHELNPVDPAGYVVTFRLTGPGRRTVAAGHFYVRAAAGVGAPSEIGNSPS